MTYARITADDVRVGDRIARAKTHHFPRVIAINEGAVSRRFALKYVEGDVPDWLTHTSTGAPRHDYGLDAGNIRPQRTAKLWRLEEDRDA